MTQEQKRLDENYQKKKNWHRWGPYLSERQWGTVREDYSPNGDAWGYFPHDHARSRTYRWGEDGIAGISDEWQRLCFSVAMWNGKDPILKERLFGLTGPEGNHGEDVKELYYYLDSSPSHAYMKHLYKYPHEAYPYDDLVKTNAQRTKQDTEYELLDTGIFDEGNYFDVFTEYAKAAEEDICIKITVVNRGKEKASMKLLPTLWFRNKWSFGRTKHKPNISLAERKSTHDELNLSHHRLGDYFFYADSADRLLFTENETNQKRIFGKENEHPFVKDAFHRAVIENDFEFLAEKSSGTKFSPLYEIELKGGESQVIKMRLSHNQVENEPLGKDFSDTFAKRIQETDDFYAQFHPKNADPELARIQRQAFAGMLWTKQYYHIDIPQWLEGDPGHPKPAESRKKGRNNQWKYLNNKDILSMPDKWEYPWYAAWDLAFHCVPLAMIDPDFAKNQLILIMREWYMAPNGQIPAYEWNFGDVNPPVQAWAAFKVYNIEKKHTGKGDIDFLKRVFQKLMLNFTWWVNRKDSMGNNVFEGGFLGLDNIGVFDRSNELPQGGTLEQADGTAWMATYSLNMMQIALEITRVDNSFEDVATKFFEHFIYIAEALNIIGDNAIGLWNQQDGFYYDLLHLPDDRYEQVKVRSLVGLSPLFASSVIDKADQEAAPDFMSRLRWFRKYYLKGEKYCASEQNKEGEEILLAMVNGDRLRRLLGAMLDESEFLSPYGIRSVSRHHKRNQYALTIEDTDYSIAYEPAESSTHLFGGNSNWRGPIWFPMNYMLIESLRNYHHFWGDSFKMEYPTGSGNLKTLAEIADDISCRLISIFQPDKEGNRPVNDKQKIYREDPHFKDLILFFEYFHGDNGRGVGAGHQTGWTGLVAELIDTAGWKGQKQ